MTDSTEVRMTSSSGAQKGQKLARYDLIPAHALEQLAELYGRGAQKYAERNWEAGLDWNLSFAALQRHAWQFWHGEDYDQETGAPHMASVAWHALALVEFMTTHPEFDNRPSASRTPEPREPRVWEGGDDVPPTDIAVKDNMGDVWSFVNGRWRFLRSDGQYSVATGLNPAHGPYTEQLPDAAP